MGNSSFHAIPTGTSLIFFGDFHFFKLPNMDNLNKRNTSSSKEKVDISKTSGKRMVLNYLKNL